MKKFNKRASRTIARVRDELSEYFNNSFSRPLVRTPSVRTDEIDGHIDITNTS